MSKLKFGSGWPALRPGLPVVFLSWKLPIAMPRPDPKVVSGCWFWTPDKENRGKSSHTRLLA